MKKKVLTVLLLGILVLGLTGCGNDKSDANSKARTNNKKYSLGEKVETDIVGFKLMAGKFTYAVVNKDNDDIGIAKEYDSNEDIRNPYVAAKGHTLVAISYYIENLDRSDVNLGDSLIKLKYDDKEYEGRIKYVATSQDNLNWKKYGSSNVLLLPGDKEYYRCYIDIDTDVNDLDSTVDLIITLPTSENNNKSFEYSISKTNRDEYKGEELTEEVAIKNYNKEVVREYFKSHINDYTILTGEEIKSAIEDQRFYTHKIDAQWKFESTGSIHEGSLNYANRSSWKIDGNNLVLYWINGRNETISNTVEVRKIRDGAYLLVEDGKIFGILYK